ncbi:MAG: helix-turn-helix transcriptional regulator [Chloroflexi bacterium]|nr:helix-turn-helix transcriptional regulator [Chloroflexota bacterium]
MVSATRPVGDLLREWRQRRRLSQLDFACEADISSKHLSFLETGRSLPSRDMVLHLAEQLDIPLRERNVLLLAAGYAPVFAERHLADPALDAARTAVDLVVAGHDPYPAFAVDGHWTLVTANPAMVSLCTAADAALLQPPVNMLRLSLHPAGLAPRIVNLAKWRTHLLERLRRQVNLTADPVLAELMRELHAYPAPGGGTSASSATEQDYAGIVTPLHIMTESGVLAFFSTTTTFGTPRDITLAELALECLYPADPATANALRRAGERRQEAGALPRVPTS